jgi:hypothetical protein
VKKEMVRFHGPLLRHPILVTALFVIFDYGARSFPGYWLNMSRFGTDTKNKGGCNVTSPSSCMYIALFLAINPTVCNYSWGDDWNTKNKGGCNVASPSVVCV